MAGRILFAIAIIIGLGYHNNVTAQFKVIGYVTAINSDSDLDKISFHQLTHLNIAFVNPDSTGRLLLPRGFDTLIKRAHRFNVKVLASLGGGSHNPYYATLLMDDNRPALVEQLIGLTTAYTLDGIDIDLEGEAIDNNYDKFIADLSRGLKPLNKLLTAAVATWNAEKISNEALNKFDFINVMSYDQTGPWRPEAPGPHSTYGKAEEDLHYWITTRGFSKESVNLGLPFYGHCFGTKYGESMSFADIITKFPGGEAVDVVMPDTGGSIYYNGLPTVQSKTNLAVNKSGGVMIWQLLQDAQGKHSLLNAIHQTINNGK